MVDVRPHFLQHQAPAEFGRWEFFRLVNRLPSDNFYSNPVGLPERSQVMYFAFAVRAELEQRAGGPVAQNAGRVYALGDSEKSYLAGLGVDANGLLAQMNQRTVATASRNARNYAEHYVNPSGGIRRPVLTVHTTGDAVAPVFHENAYAATVEKQGRSEWLLQQFTGGFRTPAGVTANGHCAFTSAQDVAGIDAMMQWLDTGQRPDAETFFPAALGFLPGFVAPPWPW
jgi:fermentation-respiration switch protein FrsA (DUF1100 family)